MNSADSAKLQIEELVFSFVDIETTGLSPHSGGRVCELAVAQNKGGKSVRQYSQLINPCCRIPDEVTKIHGITNDMVAEKPPFGDVAPVVISLLEGSVVVCHNADFDVPFLAFEFARIGLRFPPLPILDTLRYARKHARFQSNRLGNIAQELGFSNEGWHRALSDVKMTEYVFLHFLEQFRKAGAKTLDDLMRFQTEKVARKI